MADASLADRLRARMAELRIDRYEDAAQHLGVTQPTVSKWLGGEPPGNDKAETIAAFLGIDLAEALQLLHRTRQLRKYGEPGASSWDRPRTRVIGGGRGEDAKQFEWDLQSFFQRHGFVIQPNVRDAGVDFVARRENEVIGVECKYVTGPRDMHNRLRDAIAAMAQFDVWASAQSLEHARGVLVMNEMPPPTSRTLLLTLAHVGGALVVDDWDRLLRPDATNVVEFPAAAHKGDPKKTGRRRVLRPSPEPEPEGP